jgi:hypothetical protein
VTRRAGAWRVWVSDTAREDMIKAAAAAHPSETGGVLAGVVLGRGQGAGRPWVTHAVEVRSRKSGPGHYELPAGARERVVKRLRRSDARLGYLGDWHSHPTDLGPSCTDADSMASASVTGDCRRPLLLVIRRAADCYQIDARQWTGAALRRLQVRRSGPLLRSSDVRGPRPHLVTVPRLRRKAG